MIRVFNTMIKLFNNDIYIETNNKGKLYCDVINCFTGEVIITVGNGMRIYICKDIFSYIFGKYRRMERREERND